MTSYEVAARRWEHGWELHIAGVGVTQSRTLAAAEGIVRDYLATLHEVDIGDATVVVTPVLGDLGERARQVRDRTRAVQEAQRDAARDAREVARALRAEGLSITDTAAVLGVSRGRVSQLVS